MVAELSAECVPELDKGGGSGTRHKTDVLFAVPVTVVITLCSKFLSELGIVL